MLIPSQMSAPDDIQSRALSDLVKRYGWRRMAIMVDNTAYGQYISTHFYVIGLYSRQKIIIYQIRHQMFSTISTIQNHLVG